MFAFESEAFSVMSSVVTDRCHSGSRVNNRSMLHFFIFGGRVSHCSPGWCQIHGQLCTLAFLLYEVPCPFYTKLAFYYAGNNFLKKYICVCVCLKLGKYYYYYFLLNMSSVVLIQYPLNHSKNCGKAMKILHCFAIENLPLQIQYKLNV